MKLAFTIYYLSFSLFFSSCKNEVKTDTSFVENKTLSSEESIKEESNLPIVVQWMEVSEKMRLGWYQRTASNARADATLALAMFETANTIEQKYPSFLGVEKSSEKLSIDIAVSYAAAKTLTLLYPDKADFIEQVKRDVLEENTNVSKNEKAIALGETIALKAFNKGSKHTAAIDRTYPVTQPARTVAAPAVYVPQYERSAIRDYDLKYVPWTLTSQDQLRPLPPPALTTKQYAEAYNEVKNIGSQTSTTRTTAQTETAYFWFLIEMNPILRAIAIDTDRSITQNARMYAMFHMVTDDSWIAAADAKQYYQFWRPITATGQADQDENPGTQPEKNWTPLMDTPPHPEYPCGHCVQAAAQQSILVLELKDPNQVFEIKSSGAKNAKARQVTLSDYVAQTLDSRLYAGAHFRFSNEIGKDLGERVGQQVLKRWAGLNKQ